MYKHNTHWYLIVHFPSNLDKILQTLWGNKWDKETSKKSDDENILISFCQKVYLKRRPANAENSFVEAKCCAAKIFVHF